MTTVKITARIILNVNAELIEEDEAIDRSGGIVLIDSLLDVASSVNKRSVKVDRSMVLMRRIKSIKTSGYGRTVIG